MAISVCFLGEKINKWIIASAVLVCVGVALTVFLQPPSGNETTMMGITIGIGELMTLVAAILKAIANVISKVSLETVPLGIFSVYRTVMGTIVFFIVVLVLFEPSHFIDVWSPFLWQWMLLYSAVIVVGGQLFWFKGLKLSTASEVSLATAFNPIVGIIAAFFVLQEIPTSSQYIGGVVILFGIALNQIGLNRLRQQEAQTTIPNDKEMNESIAFKGI